MTELKNTVFTSCIFLSWNFTFFFSTYVWYEDLCFASILKFLKTMCGSVVSCYTDQKKITDTQSSDSPGLGTTGARGGQVVGSTLVFHVLPSALSMSLADREVSLCLISLIRKTSIR